MTWFPLSLFHIIVELLSEILNSGGHSTSPITDIPAKIFKNTGIPLKHFVNPDTGKFFKGTWLCGLTKNIIYVIFSLNQFVIITRTYCERLENILCVVFEKID